MRCGVLHRWLVVLLAAAVLYGGTPALASEPVATSPAPPPALQAPAALAPGSAPARQPGDSAPAREPAPQSAEAGETPHIALLLPLASTAFSRHAEAVRSGFLAAAKVAGGTALPVRTYAVGDDAQQTVETYIKAL